MLVLTRKTQQKIQIGPNIVVTILQVKGQAVRVGIEAPREVSVLRTELEPSMNTELDHASSLSACAPRSTAVVGNGPGPLEMLANKLRCRASGAAPAPLSRHLERTGPASRRTTRQSVVTPVAPAIAHTVGC